MKRSKSVLALLSLAPVVVCSLLLAAQQPRPAVADKVPMQAQPFPLGSVQLLDGPFRQAMLLDQKFLLSIDTDRLVHNFRVNAGLASSAKPLGGWEAPDVELRGHSLGHFVSACALMYASTGDARFREKADAVVAELAKVQQALPARGMHAGYLSAFPEEFFDRVDARQRVWAPYYTLHKIMAGLLDAHLLCANQQALDVLLKMTGWLRFRVDRLSDEQQQRALETEFGGMNDVLANLYAVTGDAEHLRLARKFDHRALFDPLSREEDKLDGLHANTQIPKMIGAAREYELTGERRYHDIATFFWQRVALHRSYVIGGHSDGEAFFPVTEFSRHLGSSSAETCNTYNMLKLTRHLFSWAPSAKTMDFYERALFNHILASQDPETGMVIYYCPLRPGAWKSYSTPDDSWWCCVGTGMENHTKYGDTIYFHNANSLYVNLFIASELNWKEKGLTIRQETHFPDEDTTRLTMRSAKPVRFAMKIRFPAWARSGMKLTVNNKLLPITAKPGSYVTVDRTWKNGDIVQVKLPMSLHAEPMPGDPNLIAILYGPIVLGGDLGKQGLENMKRYGPLSPQVGRLRTDDVPSFIGDPSEALQKISAVRGERLTFRTQGLARPADVTLRPFYRLSDVRYNVYWQVYSPAAWEKHKAEIAAGEARRAALAQRTLDAVNVSDPRSEKDHNFLGERTNEGYLETRKWRDSRTGWFSYVLCVAPDQPVKLICTYRGSEGRQRVFDVLVDGERVATQTLEYHPTAFLDFEYALPTALTRGKEHVTVKFQPHSDAATGSVFEVRIVRE